MPAEQLVQRYLASVGRLSGNRLRSGKLENNDWKALTAGVAKLNNIPLLIDDTSGITIGEIRARCRSLLRREKRIGLVVVDYLQLAQGTGENRTQEVGSLSRGLKALAKELDCPVVALSQLSRKVEDRSDRRPIMSDLRESGDVEQDADVILMLYRDEEYNKDSAAKGTAEVLIRKFRSGETGMVRVTFLAEHTRFEDYAGSPIDDRPRQRPRRQFADSN
jgi:replicative DNA helicase